MLTEYQQEIERLRGALRAIQAESAAPNHPWKALQVIHARAREALAPVEFQRPSGPLGEIAADGNVDARFRKILATGQPLTAYGREDHDMTTDGRKLTEGT